MSESRESRADTQTRAATMAGSVGLLILDATALTNVALIAPGLAWPFLAAALASLTRIGRPCRCCANASSAARALTSPAAAPPTSTMIQTASMTHASRMSLCRRSGLGRHRHINFLALVAGRLLAVVTSSRSSGEDPRHRGQQGTD
ncbi:hypothetical protein OOK36_45660 [Streptomyces sp. NBC_00365]|uniref:hypothetical protein n=1 Tax=Streptomyces sp. NBC_00365 TaxID=2975726 RepID=UPI0022537B29|nr:hypothetical protein [Streptomyces sp. NBC_00365]MCX5095967.1 hypothetical protein [Streptomyces sp. NBC_00365]